jgi:cytoskeleton protein RodZ
MTDKPPVNAVVVDSNQILQDKPFSAGTALRESRMHQGLSVDEVSHRIKFAPRQIEALEADDFSHLPEFAFLRGFVRSYARLLQLDATPLLAALPRPPEQSVLPEAKEITELPFPDANTERKQNILWLAGACLVVVALALAAWLLGEKPKEPNLADATVSDTRHAVVETLALPVSAVPDASTNTVVSGVAASGISAIAQVASGVSSSVAANASLATVNSLVQAPSMPPVKMAVKPVEANSSFRQAAIRLTFDQDAWVKITDKNGNQLLSQLNRAASEKNIEGTPPFFLVIGNARFVHLYYKGQAVDLLPHINVEVARVTLE